MDENDRKVLNRAMSELVTEIRVTSRFKAHLMSSELISDDDLDEITSRETDSEEIVFDILQVLKKSGEASLDSFSDVLRQSGQGEVADKLARHRVEMGLSGGKPAGEATPAPERSEDTRQKGEDYLQQILTELQNATAAELLKNVMAAAAALSEMNLPDSTSSTAASTAASPSAITPASDSIPARHYTTIEDQRKRLERFVGELSEPSQDGDVVVPRSYKDNARRFASGRSNSFPGPFPGIPDRISHNSAELTGINPACALELTRLYGGEIRLYRSVRNNCKLLISRDGETHYVLMGIRVKPGGTDLNAWWLKARATMEDAIGGSIGCVPATAKKYRSDDEDETFSLEYTAEEWMNMEGPGNIDVWLQE